MGVTHHSRTGLPSPEAACAGESAYASSCLILTHSSATFAPPLTARTYRATAATETPLLSLLPQNEWNFYLIFEYINQDYRHIFSRVLNKHRQAIYAHFFQQSSMWLQSLESNLRFLCSCLWNYLLSSSFSGAQRE